MEDTGKEREPGMMINIKHYHIPTDQWRTGRITALYSGKDSFTRVVSLKCASEVFSKLRKKNYKFLKLGLHWLNVG